MFHQYFQSPIGWLRVSASKSSLRYIQFTEEAPETPAVPNEVTQYVIDQLQAYFRHEKPESILPLVKKGSRFQRRVWEYVLQIPAGKTQTYQQVAAALGDIHLTRAVARALATNPVLLLIPCHRVVGKDGRLRGYAGSASRKQWLLQFEAGQVAPLTLFPA